jgi:hypothetical protein
MTSYWKLIDMENSEVISIGKNESKLIDLKNMYENKLNTQTKLVKCFGEEKFSHDWKYLRNKCYRMLSECEHKCYM